MKSSIKTVCCTLAIAMALGACSAAPASSASSTPEVTSESDVEASSSSETEDTAATASAAESSSEQEENVTNGNQLVLADIYGAVGQNFDDFKSAYPDLEWQEGKPYGNAETTTAKIISFGTEFDLILWTVDGTIEGSTISMDPSALTANDIGVLYMKIHNTIVSVFGNPDTPYNELADASALLIGGAYSQANDVDELWDIGTNGKYNIEMYLTNQESSWLSVMFFSSNLRDNLQK